MQLNKTNKRRNIGTITSIIIGLALEMVVYIFYGFGAAFAAQDWLRRTLDAYSFAIKRSCGLNNYCCY